MLMIENKYNIGDYVKLKTDDDSRTRIVTALKIISDVGVILYELSCGTEISYHYDFEILTVEIYVK